MFGPRRACPGPVVFPSSDPRRRGAPWPAALVAALLWVQPHMAVAQDQMRPSPEKPSPAELAATPSVGAIVVKFREGSAVRLEGARATAAPGVSLAEVGAVLGRAGADLADLTRLHAASPERLDADRQRARETAGRQLADLNLYYVLKLPPGADPAAIAAQLNALPIVELAEPLRPPPPPPVDLFPPTPDFSGSQGYKSAPPTGIGALDPARVPGGDGARITVVDVEYNWVLGHEDLELPASAQLGGETIVDPFPSEQGSHGTAVLGQIGGKRNGYGVTGITPAATLKVSPSNTAEFGYNSVARAIGIAKDALQAGDVILIEAQTGACGGRCGSDQVGCGPVEWNLAEFDAIAAATAKGIVVVEAAGNGQVNLDGPSCLRRFDRTFRNSGAIIVGAGSPFDRSRLWYSSYGSRVDVQGWGQSITTLGYGDAFDPGDVRQRYTHGFGGTSGASPIVTGAVAALQGALKARALALATPAEMREALVLTGTAQTGSTHIGPLPNIAAALTRLLNARGDGGPRWQPVISRGGSLVSFPECLLVGSRIDCWAHSTAGTLIWNRSLDGDSWSGFVSLGGALSTPPSCLVRGTRIDCFATSTIGRLSQVTYDGTRWGAWIDRGGAISGPPVCIPGAGSTLDCFALGIDKALYRFAFDGVVWRTPQRLAGNFVARPECYKRGTGIDCFVVEASGRLRSTRLAANRFSAFRTIATGIARAPHCLVSGNSLTCFAQTLSNNLVSSTFNGSRWAAWANAGGSLGSAPFCHRTAAGFDCYWSDSTGGLIRRSRVGTTWQVAQKIGDGVQQRPVCLPRNAGARIDCLALGTDRTMKQVTYK